MTGNPVRAETGVPAAHGERARQPDGLAGPGNPVVDAALRRVWPKPSGGVRAVFGVDLVLLHAPSVFDFRRRDALLGPVADVVPSSNEFEMYPIGLTSLAGYLAKNAYNVRIVNIAYRMLRSARYDVADHLRRLHAPVFGIDLHWLPHANGALAIAEIVKSVHPEAKVLLGGLSSSYYHEEIIRLPYVDFVLRGDSTEEPARQLLAALRTGQSLESVENLTWKRPDGDVVVNPLTFVPSDLDYVDIPDYDYALCSVFKYWNLLDLVPYLRWLKNPTTMVLNSRGCVYDCAICGGSRSAYRALCNRTRPAYRSPEKIVSDMKTIASFSAAPIFMVHDPRVGGIARARRIFDLLAQAKVPNELVIELFYPAGPDFFDMVRSSARAWSMEITIESPHERLRRVNGKFGCANERVEQTIADALDHGCRKLDLFFMVGIPGQTSNDALRTVDYCAHLTERFCADRRLQYYVAPLGPFLDPGSRAFEDPGLGYRKRFVTLTEHRKALDSLDWRDVLSFDTDQMDHRTLVETTYEVAGRLNQLKFDAGLVDRAVFAMVRDHLANAREVLAALDESRGLRRCDREAILRAMHAQVASANTGSVSGDTELSWTPSAGIRISRALVIYLMKAIAVELTKGFERYRGRYDRAARPGRDLPAALGQPG